MVPAESSTAKIESIAQENWRWLVLVALALAPLFAVQTWSGDDWWHLATGRWIAQHGEIPTTDPFTFSVPGQRWLAVPWMSDLLSYGSWVLLGMAGLVVMKMLLSVASIAISGLTMLEAGVSLPVSIALLPVVACTVQERNSQLRPETISGLLLCVLGYLLVRSWRRRDWSNVWVAPLLVLWVATHSTVVFAIVVVTAWTGCALIAKRPARTVWPAAMGAVIGVVIIAVTQTGRGIVRVVWLMASGQADLITHATSEWRPPSWSNGEYWIPAFLLVVGIVLASRRWRENLACLLLACAGGALATRSERHLAFAMWLAAPAIGLGVERIAVWSASTRIRTARVALLAFVAAGLPMSHFLLTPVRAHRIRFGFGVSTEYFPGDTLATLKSLPPGRCFNELKHGGYLIWNDVPGGVLIDGRTVHLYTAEQFDDLLMTSHAGAAAIEALADRFDVVYAIGALEGDWVPPLMASPLWVPLRHGKRTTLFVRRRHLDRIVQTGIQPLNELRYVPDGAWLAGWYGQVLSTNQGRRALVEGAVRAAEATPDSAVLLGVMEFLADAHPDVAREIGERLAPSTLR